MMLLQEHTILPLQMQTTAQQAHQLKSPIQTNLQHRFQQEQFSATAVRPTLPIPSTEEQLHTHTSGVTAKHHRI